MQAQPYCTRLTQGYKGLSQQQQVGGAWTQAFYTVTKSLEHWATAAKKRTWTEVWQIKRHAKDTVCHKATSPAQGDKTNCYLYKNTFLELLPEDYVGRLAQTATCVEVDSA